MTGNDILTVILENLYLWQPCPGTRADVHTTVNIFAWLFGSLDTEMEGEETEQQSQLNKTDSSEPKPVR